MHKLAAIWTQWLKGQRIRLGSEKLLDMNVSTGVYVHPAE